MYNISINKFNPNKGKMNNLNEEQKADCFDRITKANAEIKAICDKYEVEVIITKVDMAMGDRKYKGIESPLPLKDLVNNETDTKIA